jgi:hypothetical protein
MSAELRRPIFDVRAVVVAAGRSRAYDEREWRDALVVVKLGQIELESTSGRSYVFVRDDVLWLEGLPLRALHNRGRSPCLLLAIARSHER